MQQTLLELTQSILSSLNMDQVNSISDTPESVQVALAIKTAYIDLISRLDMPEHNQLFQLVSSDNINQPVLMTKPSGLSKVDWIKYWDSNPADGSQIQTDQFGAYSHGVNTDLVPNAGAWNTTSITPNTIGTGLVTFTVLANLNISVGDAATAYNGTNSMTGTVYNYTGTTLVLNIQTTTGAGTFNSWTIFNGSSLPVGPGYLFVSILPIREFLTMTGAFNPQENNVGQFTFTNTNNATGLAENFTFYYRTDRQPTHCCILEDDYVIFDSYDSTQDTTLQSSKTMCQGWIQPIWQMEDNFIPHLQDQNFSLLLNQAKAAATYEMKNQIQQKAEVETKRQLMQWQKYKALANRPTYFGELPDFGRRSGGFYAKPFYGSPGSHVW